MNKVFSLLVLSLSLTLNAATYKKKQIRSFLTSAYSNWGLTQTKNQFKKNPSISLGKALRVFDDKKEVTVAVIDTGINFYHEHLSKNIYSKRSKKGISEKFGLDFSQAHAGKVSYKPYDYHGHGTHVAGIIKSIHPNVRIIPIKYFSQKASGEQNLVNSIKALEHAVEMGVDIINYSGGGPEADPFNAKRELAIVKKAQKKGILIVAASGNNGSNIDIKENAYYPASYNLDNILSVGAYDPSLKLLKSSNYGVGTVHVAAPGYRINSSSVKTAARMSGTSQATAFVSGIASLIKANHPELSYLEIKNIIVASSISHKSFQGKVLGGKADAYQALIKAQQVVKGKQKQKIANSQLPNQRNLARKN